MQNAHRFLLKSKYQVNVYSLFTALFFLAFMNMSLTKAF